MFVGYRIKVEELNCLYDASSSKMSKNHYISKINKMYDSYDDEIHNCWLDFFETSIDATNNNIIMRNIEDAFFPNIKRHVFLSHSRNDKDDVLALAGFLMEKFRVTAFVDSLLWEHCDKLLKYLDDRCCAKEKRGTYDYKRRNITTSQVYVLLNNALAKMIDCSECFIFLESENSISYENKYISSYQTESPWLYSELMLSSLVEKKRPERLISINESSGSNLNKPHFIYDARLNHLIDLDPKIIIEADNTINHRKLQNGVCLNSNSNVLKLNKPLRFLDYLYDETKVDLFK